jgi:Tol biopolymer transport system component
MNDQPALDRLVTDWLRGDAPPLAPRGLLAAALERVAATGQERPLGGRRFDAWIGRSPRLHWAIVAALVALLLLGAIAGAGALLRRPAVVPHGVANGWIAVSAGDLDVGDIYLIGEGVAARRIIGADGDGVGQACPKFSPDGRRLAYGEGRLSSGQPGDDPLRGRRSVADRAVVVVGFDDHGDASPPIVRVTPSANPGKIPCPEWSPGGERVAFRIGAGLWVADAASGKTTVFPVTEAPWGQQGFEWSRDGSRIAVAEPGQIRVVPMDGGASTVIPVNGGTPGSLGWTAGDDKLVYLATDDPGDGRDLHVIDVSDQTDVRLTPDPTVPRVTFDPGFGALVSITRHIEVAGVSPDGTRVAYAYRDFRCTSDSCSGDPEHLMVMDVDGSGVVKVPIPTGFGTPGLAWSPDGTRLLLGSIRGLVSIPVAPGSPAIVHSSGELDLEWSGSEITWQPVFR